MIAGPRKKERSQENPGSARALACCFRRPRRILVNIRRSRTSILFDGGVEEDTRGRVCSPIDLLRTLVSVGAFYLALISLLLFAGTSFSQEAGTSNPQQPTAVETAWKDLDSDDATARTAARAKIEAQPFQTWKSRAIEETRPWASIEALWALSEACPPSEGPALRPHLCESITTLRIEQMTAEQMRATIRLTRLVMTRFGAPTEDERQQMLDLWSHLVTVKPGSIKQEDAPSAPVDKAVESEARALIAELSRKN